MFSPLNPSNCQYLQPKHYFVCNSDVDSTSMFSCHEFDCYIKLEKGYTKTLHLCHSFNHHIL